MRRANAAQNVPLRAARANNRVTICVIWVVSQVPIIHRRSKYGKRYLLHLPLTFTKVFDGRPRESKKET